MSALTHLDRILRGETQEAGDGVKISLWPLIRINLLLAASYGICMGVFGCFREVGPEWRQMVASALKVPSLFFLTLCVTFPSLYVFNTLLGSRLRIMELLKLVVAALSVLMAVLAAFGPITAFFAVTTANYPFILLLNVAVFVVSGLFGLGYLHKMLQQLSLAPVIENEDWEVEVRPTRRHRVIYIWMLLFGLIGTQMGWVLRPFVGSPNMEFTWFRPRDSSFLEAISKSINLLFSAGS